jgi:hypothetical protein
MLVLAEILANFDPTVQENVRRITTEEWPLSWPSRRKRANLIHGVRGGGGGLTRWG